jgi:CRP/FNR family transcriptional regulator, anaerobic regulatory protein
MTSTTVTSPDWLRNFPELVRITDRAWTSVAGSAAVVRVQEDEYVYREQEECKHFLLVAAGSIRVQKSSENGGIIALYHLAPGQTCELTTSCLLSGEPYSAEAVAETPSMLVMIPEPRFHEALIHSSQFRDYVLMEIGKGMNELVTLVEEVAFGQMDGRLARCLLGKAHEGARIESTHQELAEELGSAREVISRLLKKFERRDWVRLHRGWIEIVDRGILQEMSRHIDR